MVMENIYQANDSGTQAPDWRWYVVRTKPRQEQLAVTHLENQGYAVYLPHILLNKRQRGKWQQVREVLFPGYLFIHIDPASQNIAPVRSTLGVMGLVRFGNLLLSIDEAVIDQIRHQEQQQSRTPEAVVSQFQRGDQVAIVDGPFKGIDAAFQMAKSADRVMVLIRILGGQKAIAVDIDAIAPLGRG